MTKVLAQLPDAEHAVIVCLTAALIARGQSATVGTTVPTTAWASTSVPFVQVALDGTPTVDYPIRAAASVRITAWAYTNTAAKALANLCEGLLLSYGGDRQISEILSLTGCVPSRDTATNAQLATIAVRVVLRYAVL